jgi:hypothetical protein
MLHLPRTRSLLVYAATLGALLPTLAPVPALARSAEAHKKSTLCSGNLYAVGSACLHAQRNGYLASFTNHSGKTVTADFNLLPVADYSGDYAAPIGDQGAFPAQPNVTRTYFFATGRVGIKGCAELRVSFPGSSLSPIVLPGNVCS